MWIFEQADRPSQRTEFDFSAAFSSASLNDIIARKCPNTKACFMGAVQFHFFQEIHMLKRPVYVLQSIICKAWKKKLNNNEEKKMGMSRARSPVCWFRKLQS